MNSLIVSYSYTGNNKKVADFLSQKLSINQLEISEPKKRNYLTIGMDMLFNRVPKIKESIENFEENGIIILIAPVWMGMIASPLRKILIELKRKNCKYIFITISGGADGKNPKLAYEIEKRVGRSASSVLEFTIADFLPEKKDTLRNEISEYKMTENDVFVIYEKIIRVIDSLQLKINNFQMAI